MRAPGSGGGNWPAPQPGLHTNPKDPPPGPPPAGWVTLPRLGANPALGKLPSPPPAIPPTNMFGGISARPRDLADDVLTGRFGKTGYGNRTLLNPSVINVITVDRPTILSPIDVPTDLVFYQAEKCPTWSSAVSPEAGSDAPIKSSGAGVCYLAAAGTWYVFPRQTSGQIAYAVIPCEDPGLAARFLAEPGSIVLLDTQANLRILGTAGNSARLVQARRDRKCLIIQNTGGASSLRLSFGADFTTPATDTAAPGPGSTGFGLVLASNASITLSGDSLWKGSVFAGAAVPWIAQVVDIG